ncbi:SET domain-containing protein [Pyxidicoccus sp. MSG2]|uniref:SET domain-containing protein n=1 Tax=Pyxidicoccus sp. MSG2 TaxID=2996790 RepID=UPI002271F776|nr:SET domain-containing protein [Pyxidicoccus sp. MSG2]MCY1021665.1 SET domain-containing protein [Pyxidicoccus sp. MSG2]
MLRVKTYIAQSGIHGVGLFAGAPIAGGTVIWGFDPPVDQRFTPDDVKQMPPMMKTFLSRYAYSDRGTLVLCGDHARFMNHSPQPNCGNDPTRQYTLALRDIAQGEELTDNYVTMEDSWEPFAGIIEPERM